MTQSAPAAPAPPNPTTTAAAQTQGDVTSAVANTIMGNANQTTPYGSINYQQTGNTVLHDAAGNPLNVPSYSSTTTLSPSQQALFDQNNQLSSTQNNLAQSQLDNLTNVLSKPMDTSNLGGITQSVGSGPQLQSNIANAGPIQNSVYQGNVSQDANAPTSFNGGGPIQTSIGDPNSSRAVQNTSNAIMSRVQPNLDRNTAALTASLANQGITPGSDAYNRAITLNNQGINDAYMQADLAGNTEQNTLFNQAATQGQFANNAQNQQYTQNLGQGQFAQAGIAQNNAALLSQAGFNNNAALNAGNFANAAQNQQYSQNANDATFGNTAAQGMFANKVAAAQFGNTANQQQLQQNMALYQQPINDISALRSGSQATVPQFAGYQGGQVAGSTIGADTYNSANLANQQYVAGTQAAAANNAGLYAGLGAAAGGLFGKYSDRRLKTDVVQIGEFKGLPVYSWQYLWGEDGVGFMADEVAKIVPEAVVRDLLGYQRIDEDLVIRTLH